MIVQCPAIRTSICLQLTMKPFSIVLAQQIRISHGDIVFTFTFHPQIGRIWFGRLKFNWMIIANQFDSSSASCIQTIRTKTTVEQHFHLPSSSNTFSDKCEVVCRVPFEHVRSAKWNWNGKEILSPSKQISESPDQAHCAHIHSSSRCTNCLFPFNNCGNICC